MQQTLGADHGQFFSAFSLMHPDIKKLLALGAYVFPCVPNRKVPFPDWPRMSTNNPIVVGAMAMAHPGCNWAIDCGKSGWAILDVDAGKDKPGMQSLEALVQEHGGFAAGLGSHSPAGGRHFYFKGVARNRVGFLPGLDSRGAGGYALCPGSTINGKGYSLFGPEVIPELPVWLGQLFGEPRERDPNSSVPLTEPDTPDQVEAAAEYLDSYAPLSIEGQGGDMTAFQVACRVRDFGLSEDRARELMSLRWNPRCEPPWEEEELAQKVENAYTYAKDRQGNDTPEGRMLEAAKFFSDLTPPAESIKCFRVCELGLTRPERKWVVEGWIPAGPAKPSLFTGDGATGKSLLALQLGMSVAAGIPWLGMKVGRMPAVFVTCEDDKEELDIRIYDIRHAAPETYGRMPADTPFHLVPRVGQDNVLCVEQDGRTVKGPFWGTLSNTLKRFPGPKLLILDTVADMYAGNESNRSGVTTFLKAIIGELAHIHECTPLLIAHPPKSDQTFSGSTAWSNSVRNRVYLKHPNPKARGVYRTMTTEKSNFSAGDGSMALQWKNGLFIPVDQAELQTAQDSAVIEAINSAAGMDAPLSLSHQSPRFICNCKILDNEEKPLPKTVIKEIANRLIDEGIVKNVTNAKHGNGLFTT